MLGILFVSVVVGVISIARLFSILVLVIVQCSFLVLHQYLVLVSKSRAQSATVGGSGGIHCSPVSSRAHTRMQ